MLNVKVIKHTIIPVKFPIPRIPYIKNGSKNQIQPNIDITTKINLKILLNFIFLPFSLLKCKLVLLFL